MAGHQCNITGKVDMKRLYGLLLLILLAMLAGCGDAFTPTTPVGPIDSPTISSQPTTTPSLLATGKFQEYALPQDNSGMMRPAIDHEGRIWFGEMNRNFLAMLDPRTGKFMQITPLHGAFGIMGIEVGPDDSIWYAEQYANYIGRYFPATRQFRLYPLPTVTAPDPGNANKTLTLPSAPNDLAIDSHGNIWFTELNANALGRLDTGNSLVRQYPLTTSKDAQALDPYGITIDPSGNVWFTEASVNHLGRLDPASGAVRYYAVAGMTTALMEVASDAHGMIWATAFTSGLLVRLNPATSAITKYYAPSATGNTGGLYGITVSPAGEIWVAISAIGVIARLDVSANQFVYYTIPTVGSLPLGVVVDAHHALWFTEAGSNKIGMLQP
jgi:virginiamycin B lyase